MIQKNILRQISPVLWEIPQSFNPSMKVPARFFATQDMIDDILQDKSLEQLVNVASLPGILGYALAMPDIHEGYGFPIGGVAATKFPNGIISPGGIGYDINCGVRLLKTNLNIKELDKKIESLSREIFHKIPSGVGRGGQIKLSEQELENILKYGARWTLKNNYAFEQDIQNIESYGCLANADSTKVSPEAKKRGYDQLGTLGSGNHFVEVGFVEKIYEPEIANKFGIFENQVTVLIHTGSRGLGHQVATDYIKIMSQNMDKFGIEIPDKELACLPLSSPQGQDYFNAMCAAANFAWANRQLITHLTRQAFKKELNIQEKDLGLLYDVAHNIAKIEEHEINGFKQKVIVHRKGATRSFPAGHPELPEQFKITGQPVIIPGSMGTASYILAGEEHSMQNSLGSACHGAGRKMSRNQAKKEISGKTLRDQLRSQGIIIQAVSLSDLSEEAPFAYKDIDKVIDVVSIAGLAKKVARLKPCAVIKG